MSELETLRERIDQIDSSWLALLSARFEVTRQVGELKKRQGLPARDPAREAQQTERMRQLAAEAGLAPELAENIFKLIASAVVAEHQKP